MTILFKLFCRKNEGGWGGGGGGGGWRECYSHIVMNRSFMAFLGKHIIKPWDCLNNAKEKI